MAFELVGRDDSVVPCGRYPLSCRDVESVFAERGFDVDHCTINRWRRTPIEIILGPKAP